MSALVLILHIAVSLLMVFAAWEDVRTLRIRNSLALAVAVLFVPMAFILPLNETLAHLACGGIIFLIGIFLFFAGLFGGGDTKLLGAAALWPSLYELPAFLLIMTVAGGVLALAALALKKSGILPKLPASHPAVFGGEKGWLASLARGETVVPYGVAIAIATILTLF